MSEDQLKAQAFIKRLQANPGMQGLNAMQTEDQLLQFLQVNGPKLYPTLSSPAFFAGQSPQQIFDLLIKTLKAMTDQQVMEEISNWISSEISVSFLRHFDYGSDVSTLKEGLKALMVKVKDHELSRRNMAGPYTAIKGGLIDKYLLRALERQRYTAFEFRKIQRLKMSPEEILCFVKITALLRPAVLLFIADKEGYTGAFQNSGIITPVYAEKVRNNLKSILPLAPMALISSVVNSWISFQESNLLEATSRIGAIFSHRGVNYRANMKIDRGAETSDKSWFSISRKNYKYMGFDLDMIVELYNISSEMGW